MPSVEFAIQDQIGILTVNRPQVRNALDWQSMEAFASAIEQARADAELRALIVTGAGKTFISGGDLIDLHNYPTEEDASRMIALMGSALDVLDNLPCVTIAAMEGAARGGGCEVALACDWRIAAQDADLGFVQIRLGLTTGWGGAARLMQLVGYARALDLLARGQVISAEEAYRTGLVTHLAEPGQALPTAIQMAASAAEHDPSVVRAYKRILKAAQRSLDEAQSAERSEFPKLWVSESHVQAVNTFFKRRT
ncbi:MAG TPA: enoyl-CoA hydratase/isomerase family protein [Aggregatilineales bacterium]|nr:enoyl-CoA hydratase/isomerase family protein [Aggregatilineales bacterium]